MIVVIIVFKVTIIVMIMVTGAVIIVILAMIVNIARVLLMIMAMIGDTDHGGVSGEPCWTTLFNTEEDPSVMKVKDSGSQYINDLFVLKVIPEELTGRKLFSELLNCRLSAGGDVCACAHHKWLTPPTVLLVLLMTGYHLSPFSLSLLLCLPSVSPVVFHLGFKLFICCSVNLFLLSSIQQH